MLAAVNEFVWRNYPTDIWVNFKVFGVMPMTLLFTFMLFPIILRHSIQPVDDGEKKSDIDTLRD